MRHALLLPAAWLLLFCAAQPASTQPASAQSAADPAAACAANDGTYLTGTVLSAPHFAHGHPRDGIELSHSLLTLKADQDGKTYQVAMDNVFAAGYDSANPKHQVPAPLSSIKQGDKLALCGATYTNPLGIHFVHTNCGAAPTQAAPNGSVEELKDGTPGDNLENSPEYCRLWP